MAAKTKKKGKKRRVPRGAQLLCAANYDLGVRTRSHKTGKKFKGGPRCVSSTGRTTFPKVVRTKRIKSPFPKAVNGLRGGCGCGN